MPIPYKKRQVIQIGVYQQDSELQFVWLNRRKQVQFLSFSTDKISIETELMVRLAEDFPQSHLSIRFIGCISPHLTWTKTLILPHSLNPQECEQQCRFVLQKELPISLDELWFDYTAQSLKQGFRLDIYAIRQEVAKDIQHSLGALSLNVLDVSSHAILRAFRFLLNVDETDALYLYQDEVHSVAIMESAQQKYILQTTENLTALYEQFCRRFDVENKPVYVYIPSHIAPIDLPQDWQKVKTHFPFIALGNALWQMDLHQAMPALEGDSHEGH